MVRSQSLPVKKDSIEHQLLQPAEVAVILRISLRQVHLLLERGDLPVVRRHGRELVRFTDLSRYLDDLDSEPPVGWIWAEPDAQEP